MALLKLRKLREKRGVATLEMALILILLVMLTFGVMEYGWMFFKIQQVNNAAREGVRIAVLPGSSVGEVQARVSSMMTSWQMGGGYNLTIAPGAIDTLYTGAPVTVTVVVPYVNVELLGMSIFPTPTNLTASATMAKEGGL